MVWDAVASKGAGLLQHIPALLDLWSDIILVHDSDPKWTKRGNEQKGVKESHKVYLKVYSCRSYRKICRLNEKKTTLKAKGLHKKY